MHKDNCFHTVLCGKHDMVIKMKNIYEKIEKNIQLEHQDAVKMLEIKPFSEDFYKLINIANNYSRKTFKNKGVIFSQIGIDAAPCSVNCKFCMLAADSFDEEKKSKMPVKLIKEKALELVKAGTSEVFLMSTAEYDKEEFLTVAREVRSVIPSGMRMVANTGDFDISYAKKLKEAGFTGVYHICRLGEGTDTQAKIEDRIITLNAIKEAGLELYYCIEPIGPEHTNEQIADEIFRAVEYKINVMAVMRRICFEGSPMSEFGEISAVKLALICAVSTLCV